MSFRPPLPRPNPAGGPTAAGGQRPPLGAPKAGPGFGAKPGRPPAGQAPGAPGTAPKKPC
jgi:hypothetical protein